MGHQCIPSGGHRGTTDEPSNFIKHITGTQSYWIPKSKKEKKRKVWNPFAEILKKTTPPIYTALKVVIGEDLFPFLDKVSNTEQDWVLCHFGRFGNITRPFS